MPSSKETKTTTAKKTTSLKNNKKFTTVINTLIVLAVVAAVGGAAYIVYLTNKANEVAKAPPNFVEIPTVSSSLTSSKDGKSHSIDLDLTVEYADGSQDTITEDDAYKKIHETVSKLDYEKLKFSNRIEYIEDTVKNDLGTVVGQENISKVYVGNIIIDFPGVAQQKSEEGENPFDKLNGIFE